MTMTTYSESKQSRKSIISSLTQLVKSGEKRLLSGETPLCLTPEVLYLLNRQLESLHDVTEEEETQPVNSDLRYLHYVITNTKSLDLSHGGMSTIQAPIDVSRFTHLDRLQVKRVPPHWIRGLNKLQLRLSAVKFSRSLNDLEDLLSRESGQNTALTWSRLRTLYLPNNFIRQLDDSVSLLPGLQVLDLSHNYISRIDHQLERLRELKHVNLAYNSLHRVPTFSSQSQLTTLVLRGNHIESANGVEKLDQLAVLDLSHNVICDHGNVLELSLLTSLRQVFLSGNPYYNNPRYRLLTASLLLPRVSKHIYLDETRFTSTELKYATELRSNSFRPGPEGSSDDVVRRHDHSASTSPKRVVTTVISAIADIEQPDTTDAESDTELAVSEASGSVGSISSQLAIKTRMETMREQFGPDWLPVLNSLSNSMSSPAYGFEPPTARRLPVDDNVTPIGSLGSIGSVDSAHRETRTPTNVEDTAEGGEKDSLDLESESHKSKQDFNYGSAVETSSLNGDVKLTDSRYAQQSGATDSDDQSSIVAFSCKSQLTDDDEAGGDSDTIDMDPFIVRSLTSIETEEFLVTLSRHHLIEQSIDGSDTERLELSALQSASRSTEDGILIVRLKFDYFRRDRRERCYIMEDESNTERLLDFLQPVLLEREQRNLLSVETMECLKCGKQYRQTSTARSGGAVLECSFCGSDMVIEVSSAIDAVSSTPFGSVQSATSTAATMYHTALMNLTNIGSQTTSTPIEHSEPEFTLNLQVDDVDGRERSSTTETLQLPTDFRSASPMLALAADSAAGDESSDSELEVLDGDGVSDDEDAVYRKGLTRTTTDDTISYVSLYDSDGSVDANAPELVSYKDSMTGFRFNRDDLSYVDHRLGLHLSMTYLEQGEKPCCVIRLKCVTYTRPEEYPAILILTTSKVYIFQLHTSSRRADLSTVLELIMEENLIDVYYIEIGLDHQNIRIEFENTGYCLLLRDGGLGRMLHAKVAELMSGSRFRDTSKLQGIGKMNQEYYATISKSIHDESQGPFNEMEISYSGAFLVTGSDTTIDTDLLRGCVPISLVIDTEKVHLLRENYHIPLTRNRLKSKQDYFIGDSDLAIIDISTLRVDKSTCDLSMIGFEDSSIPLVSLRFVSLGSMSHFIKQLRQPWQDVWGVELQVYYT